MVGIPLPNLFYYYYYYLFKQWRNLRYGEVKDYKATGEKWVFKHETGHFTQVAWANTDQVSKIRVFPIDRKMSKTGLFFIKVGCGFTKWKDPKYHRFLIVCNYGEGGNREDQIMFKHGEACSACPAGTTCKDSLCG